MIDIIKDLLEIAKDLLEIVAIALTIKMTKSK